MTYLAVLEKLKDYETDGVYHTRSEIFPTERKRWQHGYSNCEPDQKQQFHCVSLASYCLLDNNLFNNTIFLKVIGYTGNSICILLTRKIAPVTLCDEEVFVNIFKIMLETPPEDLVTCFLLL